MYRFFIIVLLGLLFPQLPAQPAQADVVQLVMPGPVIEGHARYENECKRCHKLFSKTSQGRLCLDCHKQVDEDLKRKIGFHGKNKDVAQKECNLCHPEHQGRAADIVLLDAETFDHRQTNFELVDAHLHVQCSGCHNPKQLKPEILNKPDLKAWEKRKFRNAASQCALCHKAVEPHKGRLGKECQNCHKSTTWSETRFKHEKTRFPLLGEHRKISCALCHPNQRWKDVPRDCYTCHRLNDGHQGNYGKKCETCHTPEGKQKLSDQQASAWKFVLFDHDRTKFPLRDKHLQVQCTACHPRQLYNQNLALGCAPCHRSEDLHRGRFGQKCEECHQTTGWKKGQFNHDKTKFPLRDKHSKLACNKCHSGSRQEQKKKATDCFSCHELDDAHRAQQGKKCGSCHNQRGWRVDVKFEHDLSRFPLIGIHATVPCESCHLEATFKNVSGVCAGCHRKDDRHKQRLGEDCASCHNPNGWDLWLFDHDTRTKFRLEGAHTALECVACHQDPVKEKIRLGKSCGNCHRKDDIHRGEFGRDCDRCHMNRDFKQLRMAR